MTRSFTFRNSPSREMRGFKFCFFILAVGVIEAVFLNYFKVFGVKPDFLLSSVIIASLSQKPRRAIGLSLFAGILKDVFTCALCVNIFLFPLWSFFIIRLSRKISFDETVVRLGLVVLLATIHNITCVFLFICFGRAVAFGAASRIIILGALYTAGMFLPVYRVSRVLLPDG